MRISKPFMLNLKHSPHEIKNYNNNNNNNNKPFSNPALTAGL